MRCRATHHRPTHVGRHPHPRSCGYGSLRDLPGVLCLVALQRPMGSLEAIRGDGAHGKSLQIAGRTQHLDIQWGKARGRASFIVIVSLESPPCLIGMDIMRPLRVHIDVTNGTATPAQPDPQTVHLNAVQSQQQRKEMPLPGAGMSAPPIAETPCPATTQPGELPPAAPLSTAPPCTATPHTASCARLLQTADIPPETARLVRCHNPWPTEDVLFCPSDALPAF